MTTGGAARAQQIVHARNSTGSERRCRKRAGADKSRWSEPVSATCEAIKKWSEERWPDIKKKPKRRELPSTGRDEAGFYLLPMAVRTWAPRGQTPLLRVKLTREHLSAISGITLDGRLFMQVRPTSYDAEAVVGALRVCF